MIISYQGVECFKISQGDLGIVTNPQSKISADITLFTSGRSETSDKSGFVITGPGEYEIKDIFVKGFLSKGKDLLNTIYTISFEGLNLCFLGALADAEIPAQTLESLENIDILFVPIGGPVKSQGDHGAGKDVLDPAAAYKLAVSLEPGIIIPMHYDKAALDQFLKEAGQKREPIDKFVVKKKDLEGKEGEIVVLREE